MTADFVGSWLRTVRIISRNLLKRKYEPEILFLDRFLSPGDTCLHIGASDGRHTVVMSRLVRTGHIHCFEPSAFTLTVLERAIRFHGIRNVTTHRMAVGDHPGTMNLVTPVKANGHLGRSFAFVSATVPELEHLRETRGFTDLHVDPVEVCTVDQFCEASAIESVQFIRCDVEGGEIRVLGGARRVLERDRPVLLLEVHPHSLKDQVGSSAEEVRSLLEDSGYVFYYVKDGALERTVGFFDEPWRDYFCIPRDKVPADLATPPQYSRRRKSRGRATEPLRCI
jgi:FkbM family methyltransferase